MSNSSEIIAKVKQRQISKLLVYGKRLDGRGLTDYREIKIDVGVIEKAEGSAQVSIGNTKVLVGTKIEIGDPFPDIPNEGVLSVSAEFVPLAAPTFEPGPPDENSIELARVVDRGIRESKAIDTEKLCIIPGKKVFIIFVDIYVLDHDGNLFDASALASLAALINSKIPDYEITEKGEVKLKSSYTPLPIRNYPIAVTMARIDGKIIVDPSFEEEQVVDSRITITTDKNGKICAIQKGGQGVFTVEAILEAVKIARDKSMEIRKMILGG